MVGQNEHHGEAKARILLKADVSKGGEGSSDSQIVKYGVPRKARHGKSGQFSNRRTDVRGI
jgi:hypothetical protein